MFYCVCPGVEQFVKFTSSNFNQVNLCGFVKLKIKGVAKVRFFFDWSLISCQS